MSAFENKVVWITGASSGIGSALVEEFSKAGSKIILSSRKEEELEKIRKELALSDINSMVVPIDLEKQDNYPALVDTVISKFGRVDILINNGGISQRAEAIDAPIEIDRKLMEVNFFGAVALTKALLPVFVKQRSGHIVVVSSIAGKFGFYWRSAYSASKFALHGFFESLRLELIKHRVNVLIVCPGKIKTNISFNAVDSKGEKHNQMDPSHENAMTANECAQKILKAIKQNKKEVLIGRFEILTVYINRFFPRLFFKIIQKVKPT